MKIEEINGKEHIILDENEEVVIKTSLNSKSKGIKISSTSKGLSIDGDSNVVNRISGKNMIDKFYIQPTLSANEIIAKCDEWLDMFKNVHDIFKEHVLTDKYMEQEVMMCLSYDYNDVEENTRLKSISLSLDKNYGCTIIQEGVSISVDDTNISIYDYLVANTLDYYISKNYEGVDIDRSKIARKDCLYSNYTRDQSPSDPMIVELYELDGVKRYKDLVSSIIASHNLQTSSEQIITNLRNRIGNQVVTDSFNTGFEYSEEQYKLIKK